MSYHGNRIEQLSQMDGQLNKVAYGSSSEASYNEVLGELQKAHSFKKGVAGFAQSEPNCAFEAQGGGLKSYGESFAIGESAKNVGSVAKHAELKHWGKAAAEAGELKQWGFSSAQDGELKHFGKPNVRDSFGGGGFGSSAEALGNGIAFEAGKKVAELKGGYGESYAHKVCEKNENSTWDKITNEVMLGLGAAMGPAGFPHMLAAEARMMRDGLLNQKNCYGEVGSNSIQKDLIQRHKMLKSWRLNDE